MNKRSAAFDKLCSDKWAARLPRGIVTDRSISFGALLVFAAASAWRDRGKGWGYTHPEEGLIRTAAEIPPGGWPALVGVDPSTWRKWLAAAVAAGLVNMWTTGKAPLIRPVTQIEPGEQFARVEIAVLFHRKLSQRARRVFVALSLFRQRHGSVSVSIQKISDDAGLGRREVQRALRELELAGVLQPDGETAHGVNRFNITPTVNCARPPCELSPPLGVNCARPWVGIKPAPGCELSPPYQEPFSETFLRNLNQEGSSGVCAESEDPPPAPTPIFIKMPLAKKGEEAGVTDTMIDEWVEAYPGVDVRQQLRHMRQWCLNNPKRCKTASGVGAFITGWLNDEQRRSGSGKRPPLEATFEQTAPASAVVRAVATPPPVATPESRKAVNSKMADGISALRAANPAMAKILERTWRRSTAIHEHEEVA